MIFNLLGYRVIDAIDLPEGGRSVMIEPSDPPGCITCEVIARRMHSRRSQRLRDVSSLRCGAGLGEATLVL